MKASLLASVVAAFTWIPMASGGQIPETARPRPYLGRAELPDLQLWTANEVRVVVPGREGSATTTRDVPAKSAVFRPSRDERLVQLMLVSDEGSGTTCVVTGGQDFYVVVDDDLVGYSVGRGRLGVVGSFFKRAMSADSKALAVREFLAAFDDEAMLRFARTETTRSIALAPYVPPDFFRKPGSSAGGDAMVERVDISGRVMRIELRGPRGDLASFGVDLATQRLVKP